VPIVVPIVMTVVVTVVVPIVAMVIVTLVAVAVAIVSLRRGDGAAEQRERKSRSSEQTFHFDLPD
jgi:uncharacterized membrane protein